MRKPLSGTIGHDEGARVERSRLGQVVLPATVVLVVAVMILPLPASVLDILIVANLST